MASVRNMSKHTVDLRCIGRSVDPDEKVDVPDDVFKAHVWPETVWDTDSPARKSTAKKGE